jgi:PIN domain nuclease of toxin-antitoxin system
LKLLLDTHTAVWSVSSSQRLPAHIIEIIADPDNDVFVSVVSLWEIALKKKSSRDPMPFSAAVANFRFTEFRYTSLALLPRHIVHFQELRSVHRDPFDRMLVAQAQAEGLTLLTHDRALADYGSAVQSF